MILLVSGHAPVPAFQSMWDYGTTQSSLVNTINLSITYYLAAVAAAIGFRMNLFNIGVDGQYRIAALLAAAVGGALHLPVDPARRRHPAGRDDRRGRMGRTWPVC